MPQPLGGLVGDNIFLVEERVQRLADRLKKWVALRRTPAKVRREVAPGVPGMHSDLQPRNLDILPCLSLCCWRLTLLGIHGRTGSWPSCCTASRPAWVPPAPPRCSTCRAGRLHHQHGIPCHHLHYAHVEPWKHRFDDDHHVPLPGSIFRLMRSLERVLAALRREGYDVGSEDGAAIDGEAIVAALQAQVSSRCTSHPC